MDNSYSRPARVRVKPLQFWNNERRMYSLQGDILDTTKCIPSSSFSGNYLAAKKKVNNTSINLKKEEKISKRGASNSIEGFSSGKDYKTVNGSRKKANITDDSVLKRSEKINKRLALKAPKEAKDHKKTINGSRKKANITDDSVLKRNEKINKRLALKGPKEAKDHKNTINGSRKKKANIDDSVLRRSERINKSLSSKEPQENKDHKKTISGKKKHSGTVQSLEKGKTPLMNDDDNCFSNEYQQDPIDVHKLKYIVNDSKVSSLQSMYVFRNAFGEVYYAARGVIDSELGLSFGFLCFRSQEFHYESGLTKDVFVINGKGSLYYTHIGTGIIQKKPLFEGAKYHIVEGGELLFQKNASSPAMLLLLIFKLNS